jgi:hypothetical protein
VLQAKERTPTPSSSIVFIFRLAFESFEEFGDASGVGLLKIMM